MAKFILSFVLLSSVFAYAQDVFTGKFSKIEADILCETGGALIAIALPTKDAAARVWQSDPGSEEGFELENVYFLKGQLPGDYSFTATLLGNKMVGLVKDYVLKYSMESEVLLENVQCKSAF